MLAVTTVVLRLIRRFRGRASEWFCAANMFAWGATLLHPSATFTSPAFQAFDRLGEDKTGALVGGCGLVWIVGLIVNGTVESVTTPIRAICAFAGAMVYGFLALGFVFSFQLNGILSTGISNYGLISLLALYSLYWIMRDKRSGGYARAEQADG